MLVVDNRFVEGSNWPITRTDADGNMYQRRSLESGIEHEVLKNFPSPLAVQAAICGAWGEQPVVEELTYFWYATYLTTGGRPRGG